MDPRFFSFTKLPTTSMMSSRPRICCMVLGEIKLVKSGRQVKTYNAIIPRYTGILLLFLPAAVERGNARAKPRFGLPFLYSGSAVKCKNNPLVPARLAAESPSLKGLMHRLGLAVCDCFLYSSFLACVCRMVHPVKTTMPPLHFSRPIQAW